MAQIQTPFERPLLKIGSISFIVDSAIMIISTMLHPSKEDPFNHPLVLAEYAKSNSWVAIHLGQFAGGVIMFIGGFGALSKILSHSNSSMVSALSWLAFALAIMATSAIAVLQAIDGIALKFAVDTWTVNTSS